MNTTELIDDPIHSLLEPVRGSSSRWRRKKRKEEKQQTKKIEDGGFILFHTEMIPNPRCAMCDVPVKYNMVMLLTQQTSR
jgi:hypothetical protein